MSRGFISATFVGNDFVMESSGIGNVLTPKAIPIREDIPEGYDNNHSIKIPVKRRKNSYRNRIANLEVRRTGKTVIMAGSLIIAILTLTISVLAYWQVHQALKNTKVYASVAPPASSDKAILTNPLNLSVPAVKLASELQSITNQPAKLTVGGQTVPISSSTIRSWISITSNKSLTRDYLRVNPSVVSASIINLANQNVVTPVDPITVNEAGVNETIVSPVNGSQLADQTTLGNDASAAANGILAGKGVQLNAPTVVDPAQAVSIATLGKVLDVNVTTKRMYAFDNGQLVNTFLVTPGAPATPTPIGVFHIWEKLPLQTMTGYNTNGTQYVQPNVPWINYFDHNGDAVHGNYWRPASYFGNVASSHGCVGVQVPEAEWIYNWAPIGTTVITHT